MRKINMSFKETELNIYNFIKEQLSPSIYLKQLVINDMKKDTAVEVKKEKFEVAKKKIDSNNIEF